MNVYGYRQCPGCGVPVQVSISQPTGKIITFMHTGKPCTFLVEPRVTQLLRLAQAPPTTSSERKYGA